MSRLLGLISCPGVGHTSGHTFPLVEREGGKAMSDATTRGKRLLAARERQEWTLGDVADREYVNRFGKTRGVSRTTWARWENDEAWPSLEILDRVCETLGVTMDEIDPESVARVLVLAGRYQIAPGKGDASLRYHHIGLDLHEQAAA